MNSHFTSTDENLRKGICSTCDDAPICRLHMKQDRPVFFCEEYGCESAPSKGKIPEDFEIPNHHS